MSAARELYAQGARCRCGVFGGTCALCLALDREERALQWDEGLDGLYRKFDAEIESEAAQAARAAARAAAREATPRAVATLMRAAEGEVCSEIVSWLRQMADEERKRAEWTDAAALDAGDIVHTLEGDKIRFGAHALCTAAKQIEDGTWRQHAKGPAGGQAEQAKPSNAGPHARSG